MRRLTFFILLIAVCGSGCGKAKKASPAASTRDTTSPATDATQPSANKFGATKVAGKANVDTLVVPKALGQQAYIGPLADAYKRIDPASDGWNSEAFGEIANVRLKELASELAGPSTAHLASLITEDFRCTSVWGNGQLTDSYRDDTVVVKRVESPLAEVPAARGETRIREIVNEFQSHFSQSPTVKFKLYRVEAIESDVDTEVLFHADGKTESGRMEMTATWKLRWSTSGKQPKIMAIQLVDLEVVHSSNSGNYLFADRTTGVLGGDEAYEQQLLYSTDHWRSRLCRDYGLDVVANHGLAIGDVNGDMLEDVYICQQGGLPNRLFIQQPDGKLRDASAESGADWLDYSASALLVDLDNDGDKDLAVGQEQNIVLMRNDGQGKFSIGHVVPSRAQTFSLAAADYDNDGDLDIFCCGYNNLAAMVRTGAMGEPLPYHDAQNGGPNMLLQNAKKWEFVDVTKEVGLEQNNNRFSFAASWEDYDNDGDVDLYVSNDYGRNNFYRNDDGRFHDIAAELDVEDMSAGMSVSWADMNRDGWMDFYVSNMYSAAGNRITYQRQFKPSTTADLKQQYQRHARGNSLFQADGQGGFNDISESAGITMGRWAWGSKFCDLNNDGWQDIVVNNGFITTDDTGDL